MAPEPAGWSGSGNGGPALNALATVIRLMSFVLAVLGYVGYRIMTRGQRVAGQSPQAPAAITGND
jgi:hypothetical protein